MDNLALFVLGLAVSIPAGTVIIALVFAAGIDERAEKKRLTQRQTGTAPRE